METCITCSSKKAPHKCRECDSAVCKNCVQFLDVDRMSFYEAPASEELVGTYCMTCFGAKVSPELEKYDELMTQAEDITVFFIEQGKETRLIKRKEKQVKVEHCEDKAETLLRLAFKAVQGGFNGLVDVELIYEKHRDGSFKIAHFKGVGTPVQLDRRNTPRQAKLKSPSR